MAMAIKTAMTNPHHRSLGFDFGMKRIGSAVGDRGRGTTQPLTTIACRHGTPDWQQLTRLVAAWQPHEFVVGLPLAMNGDPTPMATRARTFGRQLRRHFARPVHFIDERLTSTYAHSLLGASPRARLTSRQPPHPTVTKRQRAARDNIAAQLILADYFASHPCPTPSPTPA